MTHSETERLAFEALKAKDYTKAGWLLRELGEHDFQWEVSFEFVPEDRTTATLTVPMLSGIVEESWDFWKDDPVDGIGRDLQLVLLGLGIMASTVRMAYCTQLREWERKQENDADTAIADRQAQNREDREWDMIEAADRNLDQFFGGRRE